MVEWRDIPGFAGNYQITNDGKIYSKISKKELNPYREKIGYLKVSLNRDGKYTSYRVHRLVMITYVDNPNNYEHINHINAIKDDNRIENLEWCDREYNLNHAKELGLGDVSKKIIRIDINGDNPIIYDSIHEATRDINPNILDSKKINSLTKGIRMVLKGKYKHHKNYIFRYYN
jgi:hypothetical protein